MLGLVGRSILVGAIALAAGAASAQESQGPAADKKEAPQMDTGEQIFAQVCAACHMADARGATGAGRMPALADNPRLSFAPYPINVVLFGLGGMPSLSDILSPTQIANVVGYVRTHFGNNYTAPVTEADVKLIASRRKAGKEFPAGTDCTNCN